MAIPALRELYMDIYYMIMDAEMFYYVIYYWWPMLEKLKTVQITIKGLYFESLVSIEMNNYRKRLFAKTKEINNCFKIKWIECARKCSAMLIIEKIKNNR
jgi:hypothetical protein